MSLIPSDHAWWVWLLYAIVVGLVVALFAWITSKAEKNFIALPASVLTLLTGAVALLVLTISVIRFVKWAWAG